MTFGESDPDANEILGSFTGTLASSTVLASNGSTTLTVAGYSTATSATISGTLTVKPGGGGDGSSLTFTARDDGNPIDPEK